jgi:hypothetical protein
MPSSDLLAVIASAAKQSIAPQVERWIASRNLSSGAHSRDPLARNDDENYFSAIRYTRRNAIARASERARVRTAPPSLPL